MLNRRTPRRSPTRLLSVALGFTFLAALPGDSMILAILGISFLIFIHEWGHFMACRLTGTRTETFSIGFGTRLFGWEKDRDGNRRFTVGRRQLDPADHAMDFRVALIPLGGYVKMAGELPGERMDGGPPAPDEFPAKPAWARTFIVSAGVIMNFITAIVFYFIAIQFEKSHRAPVIGQVAAGGAAWQAGIEPGDRVVTIGSNDTPTWIDLQMEIAFSSDDEPTDVVLERDGKVLPAISVQPIYDEERGILQYGVSPVTGLELGSGDDTFSIAHDEAVAVAGVPARGGADAGTLIRLAYSAGKTPVVVSKPDGSSFTLPAPTPAKEDKGDPLELGGKVALAPYGPPVVKAVRGRAKGILEVGDQLLAVSGEKRREVRSETDADELVFLPAIRTLHVLREEKKIDVDVGLNSSESVVAFLRDVALKSEIGNRVYPLESGHRLIAGTAVYTYPSSPSLDAGIQPGARILAVGGTLTGTWKDIYEALQNARPGEPLSMKIKTEDGQTRDVEVRPVELTYIGRTALTLAPHREQFHADGVLGALGMGASRAVRETKNVFRTIGALFTGNISFNKNIAGPITLVTASKRLAEDHILQLVWFLAYVSVMLAVLNILPIPVLDGGHLVFILIEKVKGSPLKEETVYNFQKVGFLLLLVLMFFAFKNDFTRLFSS